MSTTLYLRLGESAPGGITLPSAAQGTWNYSNSGTLGANSKALDTVAGSSQVATSYNMPPSPGSGNALVAVFAGNALSAQTIAAGTWTVAWAMQATNANAQPKMLIGFMKGDGTGLRGTVFALGSVGTTVRAATENTVYSASISGASVVLSAGDYLYIEVGASATNFTLAGIYADGTTAISADAAATTDAKSFITCPQTLLFLATVLPPPPRIVRQAVQRAAVR